MDPNEIDTNEKTIEELEMDVLLGCIDCPNSFKILKFFSNALCKTDQIESDIENRRDSGNATDSRNVSPDVSPTVSPNVSPTVRRTVSSPLSAEAEEDEVDEREDEEIQPNENQQEEMMIIGPNNTRIPRAVFLTKIQGQDYRKALKPLLVAVYTRDVLGTHSLTGRQAPGIQVLKFINI